MRVVPVFFALAVATTGCRDAPTTGSPPPGGGRRTLEFPVEVEEVGAAQLEYQLTADGTIDVFERVQITARVAGVVEKVTFKEGQAVRAGEILATIDPARFDLAARQAQVLVDRAKAGLAEAEAGLDRRKKADRASPGLIPAEEIATWETRVATARADLSERDVAVDRARLDRKDAYVRAPNTGVVQSRDIATGAYAQVGTLLATLVRREPLQLRFEVSETDAARLTSGAAVRFTVEGDDRTWEATINHVAEVADPKSRTVRVNADVTSPERDALRAGGFARVSIPVGARAAAPVIRELAIRPTERGFLVFVVDDGGVAHERIVELGMRTADGRVEVKKGVNAGDQVVVRGAEALRDGAKVKVVPPAGAPAAPPAGAPAAPPATPAAAGRPAPAQDRP